MNVRADKRRVTCIMDELAGAAINSLPLRYIGSPDINVYVDTVVNSTSNFLSNTGNTVNKPDHFVSDKSCISLRCSSIFARQSKVSEKWRIEPSYELDKASSDKLCVCADMH